MIEIILLFAVLVFAVLTIELKNLMHSVICLTSMCIVIGIIYGFLNAMYVMVFQLLIYAGAAMFLFLSVVMLTKREEK